MMPLKGRKVDLNGNITDGMYAPSYWTLSTQPPSPLLYVGAADIQEKAVQISASGGMSASKDRQMAVEVIR